MRMHFGYFSSVVGNLDNFYFLAIMNNAAVNISVQLSIWMYVFIAFEYMSRGGIAESWCLIFWGTIAQSGCIILHSH